jgi:hypothetical protein
MEGSEAVSANSVVGDVTSVSCYRAPTGLWPGRRPEPLRRLSARPGNVRIIYHAAKAPSSDRARTISCVWMVDTRCGARAGRRRRAGPAGLRGTLPGYVGEGAVTVPHIPELWHSRAGPAAHCPGAPLGAHADNILCRRRLGGHRFFCPSATVQKCGARTNELFVLLGRKVETQTARALELSIFCMKCCQSLQRGLSVQASLGIRRQIRHTRLCAYIYISGPLCSAHVCTHTGRPFGAEHHEAHLPRDARFSLSFVCVMHTRMFSTTAGSKSQEI